VSPDHALEQSEAIGPHLHPAGDLIGRDMVAMRIVSPTHEQRACSDCSRAIDDRRNCALGLFAFMTDKAIWKPEEKYILGPHPKLYGRLFRFFLAERRQPFRREGFAVRMRSGAITDNGDFSKQTLSARGGDPPQPKLSSSGCGATTMNGRSSSASRTGRDGSRSAALRSSPTVTARDPVWLPLEE
jgi:hypothetical protein